VIGARRDIRRFRPDPLPVDVLTAVLASAHAAPSVGHSQPWRFVVVNEPATRDRAALPADRERHAQAARLDGLATSVAALLAVRLEPAVAAHLIAGQRSREVAHPAVLADLGLEPLLDLRIRAGEGVGACLAAQLVRSASDIRSRAARTSR
jgi:nitroreductase